MIFVWAEALRIHVCPTLQAHFLSLAASVLQHKKNQSASTIDRGFLRLEI